MKANIIPKLTATPRVWLLLFALVMAAPVLSGYTAMMDDDDEWKVYEFSMGNFNIRFPQKPAVTSTVKLPNDGNGFGLTSLRGDVRYEVKCVKYGSRAEGVQDLNDFIFNYLSQSGYSLQSALTVYKNRHLVKELKIIFNDQYTHAQFFLIGNYYYQLEITQKNGFLPDKEVRRFFDSFMYKE